MKAKLPKIMLAKLEEVSKRISLDYLTKNTGLKHETIEDIRLYICQDTKYKVDAVIRWAKSEADIFDNPLKEAR